MKINWKWKKILKKKQTDEYLQFQEKLCKKEFLNYFIKEEKDKFLGMKSILYLSISVITQIRIFIFSYFHIFLFHISYSHFSLFRYFLFVSLSFYRITFLYFSLPWNRQYEHCDEGSKYVISYVHHKPNKMKRRIFLSKITNGCQILFSSFSDFIF